VSAFTYAHKKYDYYEHKEIVTTKVKWYAIVLMAATVSFVAAVCCLIFNINKGYEFYQQSGAQYDLAVAAPNAALTATYLQNMENGLDSLGVTTGYSALVFKSEANSIPVYRHNVDTLIVRAQHVATISQDDISYQYAVTNLNKAVEQLGTVDNGVLWVRYWPSQLIIIFGFIFGIVGLIWGLIWRLDARY
jgi:hypothetical protein